MKTTEDKLAQVRRIMKYLLKRGSNNEKINAVYHALIKEKWKEKIN